MNIEQLELTIAAKQTAKKEVTGLLKQGITTASLKQAEIDAKTAELQQLSEELVTLTEQLGEAKLNQVKNTDKRGVDKVNNNQKVNKAINQFLRGTKEGGPLMKDVVQATEGITTENSTLILKTETIFVEEESNVVDLEALFTKETVTAPSGKFVTGVASDQRLHTKEELKATPQLEDPEFVAVSYDVTTYAGKIPVSNEALQSADIDLSGYVKKSLKTILINTKNYLITEQLKTMPKRTITEADGLRLLVATGLPADKKGRFIVSQTASSDLGGLRYPDGRPVFQPDPTKVNEFRIHGAEVIVVEDRLLGSAGDSVGYYVSEDAVVLIEQANASLMWEDKDLFAQFYAVNAQLQAKIVKEGLGYGLTFNFQPVLPAE